MPLFLPGPASALPLFDPFADATASGGTSYTVGSTLTNQFNPALFSPWYQRGNNFPGATPLIASGSLSYTGLPASTGNSASFIPASNTSACAELNTPGGGGTPNMIFASFLLKITDISAVPTSATDNAFAAFGDDPSRIGNKIGRLGCRLLTKKLTSSTYVLGTSKSATTGEFVYDVTAHNVGDVLFVVQGYQQAAGGDTNVWLWINPSSSTFGASTPPAATVTALTGLTALNVNGARLWALMCQNTTAPGGVIDDLRISTSWAEVTGGPAVYSAPTNLTLNAGSTATFRVGAFGGAPLGYYWQKDGNPLSNGGNISGATTNVLTISNVLAGDQGSYSVIVSNSYSQVTSVAATLAVNDPWISVQPTNTAVNGGSTAVLQIVAVGTPTLSYQWYKDNSPLSDGGHISGALTNKLTISSFDAGDVGTYYVVVVNGLSTSVTSSNAVVGFSDPSISVQPQSVTNIYGTTATFEVTASGTMPFSYQWHREGVGDLTDGGNISGSQSNILTIAGVAYFDSGTYSVTVSNSVGTVDSDRAVLTVRDPAIVTQPVSTTNLYGTTATFHTAVVGTGAPNFTYTWYKGANILLDDGVKYAGAFTDTLSISNVSAADQDTYSLTVTGTGGSESSVPVTLTAVPPPTPITITVQPTARKVLAGSKTTLAVGYTGSDPQFQWLHEGTNVPGATAAAYVLNNVQPPVTGSYQVIVSNSINAQTSAPAVVSIVSSLHLYPTNVTIIRVGDGAQGLTTHGNSMFLDQWAPDGTLVGTLSIPDSGPASLLAIGPTLTVTPSSVTGNGLSHSANGRFLVIGGYNTNLGFSAELQSTGAGTVPRGIALIDDNAHYTLAISSSSTSSGNFWRGAATDGTNNYWGFSRTSSTYYFGFDVPGLVIQTDWSNLRSMAIFNGRLYGVSAVTGKTGVSRFAGLPTAAETVEVVINTGSNFTSDCEVSPDGTLIYVADNRTSATGGGIQRWQFADSSWSLAYTLNDNLPGGAYYVTADFSGADPVIYAVTTEDSNNQIVKITDTGSGSTGTIIGYAGVNQNFRGVRLGPAPTTNTTRPLLSETPDASGVILNWNGSFFLQSAPNVTGTYVDVVNGTRPYTNASSAGQKYFRLRQ